jgi:DNA-binding NarL/FixJ family response regulator
MDVSLKNVPKEKLKEAIKTVLNALNKEKPEHLSVVLKMAISNEEYMDWWNITPSLYIIKDLANIGILVFDGKSKYKLIDKEQVIEALRELDLIKWKPSPGGPSFPVDESIFTGIVGYDIVKKRIVMALKARRPVHVLLLGDPGTGKSLFLDSIRDFLKKKNACVEHIEAVKGLTTSVGLVDVLLNMQPDTPCVLLIDEIDKLPLEDLGVLYRLMETGEVVVSKHKKRVYETRQVWVIAACNDATKLHDALLSRFDKIKFRSLTPEEYVQIVPQILVVREGIDPDLARYIAESLSKYTNDVREAIRISRLSYNKDDVDWLIKTTYGKKT